MKITGFRCVSRKGKDVPCDTFGNNVAFSCENCSHPVLAIMRENQRGSDAVHPTECPKCHSKYWLAVNGNQRTIRLWVSN
jgi:Zn finger protein HypA/HybF involved in hydrogenase expression